MEYEFFRQIFFVSPYHPTNAGIHKAVLVTANVDALHQRQPEVPLQLRIQEGCDEAATRSIYVNRSVPPVTYMSAIEANKLECNA